MADHFYDWVSVATPSYSNFDLSYAKYFTTDFFRMVPVCCEECYPGDKWTIGNRIVVRFQPMFAPVMADISVRVHYFFVPYRLLWSRALDPAPSYTGRDADISNPQVGFQCYYGIDIPDDVPHVFKAFRLNGSWSDFIRGEVTLSGGNVTDVSYLQPRAVANDSTQIAKGTLWDYFGFPTVGDNGDFSDSSVAGLGSIASLSVVQDESHDDWPLIYPWAAYNFIWNEYYRDDNYGYFRVLNSNLVANCAYAKDYFTSALPFQQKGEPVALPVSTVLSSSSDFPVHVYTQVPGDSPLSIPAKVIPSDPLNASSPGVFNSLASWPSPSSDVFVPKGSVASSLSATSTAFDIADLRFAFQVQRFLERSARGGTRLTEFLRVHYGVSPRDERLQRPEYIGGTKQPIIISEVLQTGASESGSPQGTMAGHAISVDSGFAGSYYVTEPGLIMGIMSIVPKAHYQQGIDRAWLRRSRYDFYFPEFQQLSEQGVERGELYFSGVKSDDETIIGYQGRFNELRTRTDKVCGDFRDMLDYWHLGRKFSRAPAINASFIYGSSEDTKRIFAVQDEDPILVSFGNLLRARRALVKYPEPGLIDHH